MTTPPLRSEKETESLVSRLDALVASSNTSQLVDIHDFHQQHLAYMRSNYGRFMGQFEMYFCAMVDYSHNLNYLDKKDWPINRGFQFIITTRALKQLHTAYTLLGAGAYEDSLTILRSAYESFLRIVFVSCHPESPYNAYKADGQTGVVFNATNFVKQDLKLDWTKYGIASAFAHSNSYQVMGDMIDIGIQKEAKLINFTFEQNDDMIGLVSNFINFLCTAYLNAYDQLFTADLSKHGGRDAIQPYIDKLHEYTLICHETLRTHEVNKYWRDVAVDLDNIFELMTSMDADSTQDWKTVWQTITH